MGNKTIDHCKKPFFSNGNIVFDLSRYINDLYKFMLMIIIFVGLSFDLHIPVFIFAKIFWGFILILFLIYLDYSKHCVLD